MIETIPQMQSSPCGTGACAPSESPQKPAPLNRTPQNRDTVKISDEGREQQKAAKATAAGIPGETELSFEQQREVDKLQNADLEIKAHERAHMAAGAGLVRGGASYQYQRGPDGKQYAVSGEVKIDVSREKDPKDTIIKMQQVRRAALAPSQPSAQDRSIAARASQIEAEARIEMMKENEEKEKEDDAPVEASSDAIPAAVPNAYDFSSSEPTFRTVA